MSEWALIAPRDFLNDLDSDVELEELGQPSEAASESPRKGQKWTFKEDMELVKACISGISIESIASETGRSTSGLQSRLGKWFLYASLGHPSHELDRISFSGDGWDEKKLEQLFLLWESDLSLEKIAAELKALEYRVAIEAVKSDLIIFDEAFFVAVKEFYNRIF